MKNFKIRLKAADDYVFSKLSYSVWIMLAIAVLTVWQVTEQPSDFMRLRVAEFGATMLMGSFLFFYLVVWLIGLRISVMTQYLENKKDNDRCRNFNKVAGQARIIQANAQAKAEHDAKMAEMNAELKALQSS